MAADTIAFALKNDAGTTLNTFALPLNKLDATAAPGVANDDTQGYVAGSMWVDRTNDKIYDCKDNATGAAIWSERGVGGGSGTGTTTTTIIIQGEPGADGEPGPPGPQGATGPQGEPGSGGSGSGSTIYITETIEAEPPTFGPMPVATKGDQESGLSSDHAITPSVQQSHPSAAKAWCRIVNSAGVPSLQSNYNVSSVTDVGVGKYTVNLTTPFSSTDYSVVGTGVLTVATDLAADARLLVSIRDYGLTSFGVRMINPTAPAFNDGEYAQVVAYGDQ